MGPILVRLLSGTSRIIAGLVADRSGSSAASSAASLAPSTPPSRFAVDPLGGRDHRRAHMLDIVDADISVDRATRNGAVALADDVEVAVGPDLLAKRKLKRCSDLAGDPAIR